MTWKTPKTNWNTNPHNPTAIDFNRIEGNTLHVLNEIEEKKGGIIDAINYKNNKVALDSSYQDLADKIIEMHDNPRMAMGSRQLVRVNDSSAKLVVSGLPFKPARIFIRGEATMILEYHWDFGFPYYNDRTLQYAVLNNVLVPNVWRRLGVTRAGGIRGVMDFSMDFSLVLKDDGFEATFGTPVNIPDDPYTSHWKPFSSNISHQWYAYEQEG